MNNLGWFISCGLFLVKVIRWASLRAHFWVVGEFFRKEKKVNCTKKTLYNGFD